MSTTVRLDGPKGSPQFKVGDKVTFTPKPLSKALEGRHGPYKAVVKGEASELLPGDWWYPIEVIDEVDEATGHWAVTVKESTLSARK